MRFTRVLLAVALASTTVFAADDRFVGNWKINTEKSKSASGSPVPTSVMSIDATADGYHIKLGSGSGPDLTLHLDGNDYPRESMGIAKEVGADVVNAHRVNAHTIETVFKRNGKAVATVRREVSADGRTLTATTDAISPSGEKRHNQTVYDKQ